MLVLFLQYISTNKHKKEILINYFSVSIPLNITRNCFHVIKFYAFIKTTIASLEVFL